MKRFILLVTLIALSIVSFSQSDRYQKGMEKSLAALDSARTPEDYQAVASSFERIGDAEKNQWLPYYYGALALENNGFSSSKVDKDQVATQAELLIAKADALAPNNAELSVLKNMAATLRMLVDPMNRYQQYGAKASAALGAAKQQDANNPRIYLMEAETLMNTPAQFGGGKDKARVVIEKSIALYKSFKPASPLHPMWGQSRAEKLYEAASK